MNKNQLVLLLLILILVISQIAGCKYNDTSKTNADKIREMVESDLALPEGVRTEDVINIAKSPEGDLVLFTGRSIQHYDDINFKQHNLVNGVWTSKDATWLEDSTVLYYYKIIYGQDGNLYAVANNEDGTHKFIKSTDGIEKIEIKLDGLNDYIEDNNGNRVYRDPRFYEILENGWIAMQYGMEGILYIYSNERDIQKELDSVRSMTVQGNKLIALSSFGDQILMYDAQDDFSIKKLDISKMGSNQHIFVSDKDTYIVDGKGIHRLSEGGSLWETIVDGQRNSLSIFEDYIQFGLEVKDTFYVQMRDYKNNKITIKQYEYGAVSNLSQKELKIYSLVENSFIRQAVIDFQNANPDIKVDYISSFDSLDYEFSKVSGLDETIQDQIKVVNTEILAGKGADILVLDDLPIESYKKKGVLQDISQIVTPLVENGDLLDNIIKPYYEGDKMYFTPLLFSIPILLGDENIISDTSYKGLAQAADLSQTQLFGQTNTNLFAGFILSVNWDEIIEDGKVNYENLKDVLSSTKIIMDNSDIKNEYFPSYDGRIRFFSSQLLSHYLGKTSASIQELNHVVDYQLPIAINANNSGGIATFSQKYNPEIIVGINQSTKQKEAATQFLAFLLSENAQNTTFMTGLPVNKHSFEQFTDVKSAVGGDKSLSVFSVVDPDTNTPVNINLPKIEKKDMETIRSLAASVNSPIQVDMTLIDIILKEAVYYFDGEKELDDVAQSIENKTELYMAQ